MKNIRVILPVLLFIFCSSYTLDGEKVWHRTFTRGLQSTTFVSILGDSSLIYAAAAQGLGAYLYKSTDMGETWEYVFHDTIIIDKGIIRETYLDKNANAVVPSFVFDEYRDRVPYQDLVEMVYPAPGYMYFLYFYYGGIRRFDETTLTYKHEFELGTTEYLWLDMLDSITGVAGCVGRPCYTRDGWKTSLPAFVEKDSANGVQGTTFITYAPKMLHKDTVMFSGRGIYKGDWCPRGFYNMVIHGDTAVSYELLGDTFQIQAPGIEAANFHRFNDSTWVYAAQGRRIGSGYDAAQEIYKTTDGGHTYQQVFYGEIAPAYGLDDIAFKDSLNGIASGDFLTLITTDGGDKWEVNQLYYDADWNQDTEFPWSSFIYVVESDFFLGTWNYGIYKYKDHPLSVVSENESSSKLYPNPIQAGQTLHLDIGFINANRAYIYDIHGQTIDEFDFFGSSIMIPSDISPGTYFIVVESGDKYPIREKFVVK